MQKFHGAEDGHISPSVTGDKERHLRLPCWDACPLMETPRRPLLAHLGTGPYYRQHLVHSTSILWFAYEHELLFECVCLDNMLHKVCVNVVT